MRVRHIINTLDTGGAERLVVDLTMALRGMGVDASIITLGDCDPAQPPWRAAQAAGVVTSLGRPLRDPRLTSDIRNVTAGADVVHAHLFPTLYWTAMARLGASRLYTEHSTHNRRRGRRAFELAERLAYRPYAGVVAISPGVGEATREHFRALGIPTPVTVIRNGIDLTRFRTASHRRESTTLLRLVMVGSLDRRKDPLAAVRALAGVSGVTLTIVGDGPLRGQVEAETARLGLTDRIRVLGIRSDVPDLLADHDAFLMTSRYEGFGLAAAEALAAGLPILAPDVPGLRDVVEAAGILHPPGNTQALRADIMKLVEDEALRAELAARALAARPQLDIRTTAEGYLSLYESLLSRKAS